MEHEKKLTKEQAEKIKKRLEFLHSDHYCLGYIEGEIVDIIDSMTEKTPEEELAEYKCPKCNSELSISGIDNNVYCCSCRLLIGSRDFYYLMPCYQPDWNGGKRK